MPKITDTYERAYQACATLAAAGVNPTVKTVAEAIGTNSPTIISPAIKDWKRSVAAESLRRLEIPDVPAPVAEAAAALWRLAMEQAEAALAKQRSALLAQAGEPEVLRLNAEREMATLREALQRGEAEWAAARPQQAELAQTREANAALAAALEEARQALTRQRLEWAEQFEHDHRWHLTRIAEERERAKLEAEAEQARLREALAVSRQHAATLDAHLSQAAAANVELRGELKTLRSALEAAPAGLSTIPVEKLTDNPA
jgi:hypothetical protein